MTKGLASCCKEKGWSLHLCNRQEMANVCMMNKAIQSCSKSQHLIGGGEALLYVLLIFLNCEGCSEVVPHHIQSCHAPEPRKNSYCFFPPQYDCAVGHYQSEYLSAKAFP